MAKELTKASKDYQEIEISIKREQFVAFWKNTVIVLNKTENRQRTYIFCNEKKLKEDDVMVIFKKFGLDLSCLSLADWKDNEKWDLSEYEESQGEKMKSLTIRQDGSVKPIATCKVKKMDDEYLGVIQILCGTMMHKYQYYLPFGIEPEQWIEGFNEWVKRLPTFKSVDSFNAWKEKHWDIEYPLVCKIKEYYDGLIKGHNSLLDSDTEQEVFGLEPNLSYHLSIYQNEKEKYYSKYPDYYDRCEYYISELSKDMEKVKEFHQEYEYSGHPALEHRPPQDEIVDIFVTYECYLGAKEEAPQFFTDEYIAEHFKF